MNAMDVCSNCSSSNALLINQSLNYDSNAQTYVRVSFLLAWLILTFCLLSFFTNLLSALVYSQRCMRSPINVLLTGHCAIDLLLSAFWIPAFVVPCLYVYYRSPTLKSIMSYTHVYIYPFTMIFWDASVWTFVVISIERLIAVCRPFRARWSSNRRSVGALILVLAASTAYNFVRFFEFRILRNDEDPSAPVDTEPALRDSEKHPMYMAVYYNGLFLVVHFLIPFTVLAVVNALMIASIYRAGAQRRLLSTQQKRENRTAVMMAFTVVSFLSCNTLQLILNAVEMVNPEFFIQADTIVLAFTLNDICNLLVVFNMSCTVFIYYFFCQKYRRVASDLFARIFSYGAAEKQKFSLDFNYTSIGDTGTQFSIRFHSRTQQTIVARSEERRSLPNSARPLINDCDRVESDDDKTSLATDRSKSISCPQSIDSVTFNRNAECQLKFLRNDCRTSEHDRPHVTLYDL